MGNRKPVTRTAAEMRGTPSMQRTHARLEGVLGVACGSRRPCRSLTARSGPPQTGRRAWRYHGTSQLPTYYREASTAIPSTPRCTWMPGARTQWSCSSTMWSPWSSLSRPMPSGESRRGQEGGGHWREQWQEAGTGQRLMPGWGVWGCPWERFLKRDSEVMGQNRCREAPPTPTPSVPLQLLLDGNLGWVTKQVFTEHLPCGRCSWGHSREHSRQNVMFQSPLWPPHVVIVLQGGACANHSMLYV